MLSNLQLDPETGEVLSAEALMNIWVLEDHGVKVNPHILKFEIVELFNKR